MAISPVSDIVLEVARAADPAGYRAAAARLGGSAGASAPDSFAGVLDGMPMGSRAAHAPFDPALAVVRMRNSDTLGAERASPYEQFEAFVLQTFIQSMLPKNSEAMFGTGTAGEIWRSMLAESLGTQLAQTGGIGIARMLADAGPEDDRAANLAERPAVPADS